MKKIIALFSIAIVFASCKKEPTKQPDAAPPIINSLTPGSGQPETSITISGTNFSTAISGNVVKFNGVTATIVSVNASSIIAKVPVGAGNGSVTVTTSQGTSSGIPFSYLPDIYIGGTELNGANSVAKYWKNGIPVSITDGTKFVFVYSMALSGSDVYLAGSEPNANGIAVAKYWKNGIAKELSDGKYPARVLSIIIVGNDVYAVGSEENGTSNVAKYWKNGVPVALTDGTRYASANSIFVSGNDVYVAGEEAANNGVSVATYWKNGFPVRLTSNINTETSAMQIAVANNDIHITIYQFNSNGPIGIASYDYWKNGIVTPVSGATQIDQLLIAGTDVYMVGRQSKIATYWKNGTPVPLTDGSNIAFAHSITLYGNDVYVAGNEYNGSAKVAKYWKNSVPTILTDGKNDASPWSIIVR